MSEEPRAVIDPPIETKVPASEEVRQEIIKHLINNVVRPPAVELKLPPKEDH